MGFLRRLRPDHLAGQIAMLVLAAAAFAYRITVEEAALLSTLGEPYARYMRRL